MRSSVVDGYEKAGLSLTVWIELKRQVALRSTTILSDLTDTVGDGGIPVLAGIDGIWKD